MEATDLLTQYSQSSGCGCKLAPDKLEAILGKEKYKDINPLLLVGNETRDDAAAFDLQDGRVLISTTDFFTPVVNDAYDFGRVAAANSISDVYAMGGTPVFALAILGWPEALPLELAAKVMEGGKAVCREASISIAGGHSISSKEPFFGLCVNGFAPKSNLKKNSNAFIGDLLFLTKPIGSGIMTAALKRGQLNEIDYGALLKVLLELNKLGSLLGTLPQITAMTDVTGFGLLGHLLEMCDGAGVSAELDFSAVHLISGAEAFIKSFCFPDNTYRNWNACSPRVPKNLEQHFIPLCDPQTNGGLLVSVKESGLTEFLEVARKSGLEERFLKPIGRIIQRGESAVVLVD